jgi:hypothetical protein
MPNNTSTRTAQRLEPSADEGDDVAGVAFTVDDFVPPAPVRLGPPFAIAADCDLLPHEGANTAAVQCGKCSTPFLLSLLRSETSRCPECKQGYTHALVVATIEDTAAVDAFVETVALANGFTPGSDDDDSDDEESDDDEGERPAGVAGDDDADQDND